MSDRIRTLRTIKTEEENEENKKILNNYKEEYVSFIKDPRTWKNLLLNELKINPERIDLEIRLKMINEGTYAEALKNNILAHFLAEREYETGKTSVVDFLKAFIVGNEDEKQRAKKSFKERFAKSRADAAGIAIPINFNLQSPQAVLEEIFKENEFINIPKPEVSLVPVATEVNRVFAEEIEEMFNEYLEESGINITNTSIIDEKARVSKPIEKEIGATFNSQKNPQINGKPVKTTDEIDI